MIGYLGRPGVPLISSTHNSLTGGLPVKNILVVGDHRTISLRDLRSSGRYFGKHSSKGSTQMKTRGIVAIAFLNIPIKSASCGPLLPNSFLDSKCLSQILRDLPSIKQLLQNRAHDAVDCMLSLSKAVAVQACNRDILVPCLIEEAADHQRTSISGCQRCSLLSMNPPTYRRYVLPTPALPEQNRAALSSPS